MSFNLILSDLMSKNNITKYRLATDLGVSKGTIANYLNGTTTPQSSIYNKIMDYFNNINSSDSSIVKTKNIKTKDPPSRPPPDTQLEVSDYKFYEIKRLQEVVEEMKKANYELVYQNTIHVKALEKLADAILLKEQNYSETLKVIGGQSLGKQMQSTG